MLITKNVIAEVSSPEDIISIFKKLAEIDNDFNGENGEEYLWTTAKQAGYESNASYLADVVISKKGKSLKEYVDEYVDTWIGGDNYYREYEVDVQKVSTDLYVVCLAVTAD